MSQAPWSTIFILRCNRVYVGNNDFNGAGRTASREQSLNAATAPPPGGMATVRIETRSTFGQDMPAIRPIIHPDGTVYAVFYRRTGTSGGNGVVDVVVVRDDTWGSGATPFTALVDGADGLAGRLVRTGRVLPFNTGQALGQERLVSSNLSIAVDPRDSSNIYVAWADFPAGTSTCTLHVIRSTDREATRQATISHSLASDAMPPAPPRP